MLNVKGLVTLVSCRFSVDIDVKYYIIVRYIIVMPCAVYALQMQVKRWNSAFW